MPLIDSESPDESIRLSSRALQILGLASEGKSNKEIAKELDVTEHTIDWHWRQIRRQLGTTDRTASVCKGLRLAYHRQLDDANERLRKSLQRQEQLQRTEEKLAKQVTELSNALARITANSRTSEAMSSATLLTRSVAYELSSLNPVTYKFMSQSATAVGLDPSSMVKAKKTFYEVIHPEDLQELYRLSSDSIASPSSTKRTAITYRLLTPEPRWMLDIHIYQGESDYNRQSVTGIAFEINGLVEAGVLPARVLRINLD